jgi:hypothetical protein
MTIHYPTAPLSPREKRRDKTTWVRFLKDGSRLMSFSSHERHEEEIRRELGWFATVECHTISDGPCHGVEYLTADGKPVAWIDEGGVYHTDEINEALTPMRQAAE